jgi:hypothetical protein
MGIVRNCIDIIGITPEQELPKQINGQLIETSEVENLFIDSNIQMKNIYQIIIEIEIKATRVINAPLSKIIVIDGYKKFKIAYYDINNNMSILELKNPYNLFFDIEKSKVEIEKTNIYIADAYFELVNSSVIYCHVLYVIDISYFGSARRIVQKNQNKQTIDFYTVYDDTKNDCDKYDVFKKQTISEYNKVQFDENRQVALTEENDLIDIDSEYP